MIIIDFGSEQDNSSVQRSVQTGATAGSDAAMASLALFSDDESGDSTGQEEDESDAGETDEQDTEEFAFSDEIDRRNAAAVPATATPPVRGSTTTTLAPQSMMWAIRHRENNSAARNGSGTANGAVITGAKCGHQFDGQSDVSGTFVSSPFCCHSRRGYFCRARCPRTVLHGHNCQWIGSSFWIGHSTDI